MGHLKHAPAPVTGWTEASPPWSPCLLPSTVPTPPHLHQLLLGLQPGLCMTRAHREPSWGEVEAPFSWSLMGFPLRHVCTICHTQATAILSLCLSGTPQMPLPPGSLWGAPCLAVWTDLTPEPGPQAKMRLPQTQVPLDWSPPRAQPQKLEGEARTSFNS